MKYSELFNDGGTLLFSGIFKERYPDIYAEIFADTLPDTFAMIQYGNREIIESMTPENVKGYCGAILDMCADSFKSRWDTFSKKYDFLKPVVSSVESEKTISVNEMNTNGKVKADKAFNDSDFVNDSKEDQTNDRDKTEKETGTVTQTGFTGNVTEAMLNEYRARLLKVREEIVKDLVSYITLSIYN